MRYQYKREPLTADEATRLANACNAHEEKLVVWTLLDTGRWVCELANLKRANLDWQNHRLMIYGKGGPCGSRGVVSGAAEPAQQEARQSADGLRHHIPAHSGLSQKAARSDERSQDPGRASGQALYLYPALTAGDHGDAVARCRRRYPQARIYWGTGTSPRRRFTTSGAGARRKVRQTMCRFRLEAQP